MSEDREKPRPSGWGAVTACRIPDDVFAQMAEEERARGDYGFSVVINDDSAPERMVFYDFAHGTVILYKKPVQALVDEPEQARPIVRNLLRWAHDLVP